MRHSICLSLCFRLSLCYPRQPPVRCTKNARPREERGRAAAQMERRAGRRPTRVQGQAARLRRRRKVRPPAPSASRARLLPGSGTAETSAAVKVALPVVPVGIKSPKVVL